MKKIAVIDIKSKRTRGDGTEEAFYIIFSDAKAKDALPYLNNGDAIWIESRGYKVLSKLYNADTDTLSIYVE